jgi:hypothetical protein
MLGFSLFNFAIVTLLGCSQITVDAVAPDTPSRPFTGDTVLATHDFRDGTFGPFGIWNDSDVTIVSDPTGAGRGKVARVHFSNVGQPNTYDVNRHIGYEKPDGIGLGESIFFRGDLYLPPGINTDPQFAQRKLLYYMRHDETFPGFWSVVTLFGTNLQVTNGYVPQDKNSTYEVMTPELATLSTGRWYKLETQLTLNSKPSASDGIFRLWLDGVLLYENTNLRWSDPAWAVKPGDQKFQSFRVGQQVNSAGRYDEYRYWSNVTFSTKRLR